MNNPISRQLVVFLAAKTQWLTCLRPFAIIVATCWALNIQAHPHSWVDLKTEIEGEQGKITGFKMSWTFDAITSAYLLDGEDLSAANKEATLQKIANSVMANMLPEHYFTYFYDGETPIKYALPGNARLSKNRTKLTLDFHLPLAKAQQFKGKTLKLLIFEPGYYVDMSWPKSEDIQLSADLAEHCTLKLVAPDPTAEQVTYAMSLPADADPDNALGQLFTQTALITCPAVKG